MTVAVFAAGMLFVRPYSDPPTYQAGAAASQAEGKEKQVEGDPSAWWPWLSKDAAGFFTFGLVVVGIGQALLFFIQLRYMRKGMDDAKAAAEAAKAASEATKAHVAATIQAERPYVVFSIVQPGLALSQNALIIPDIKTDGRLHFEITNVGRTPALLEEFREKYFVIEGRGEVPSRLNPMEDRGRLLPVGTVATATRPYARATNLFNEENVPDIRKMMEPNAWCSRRLHCHGFVRYSDAFGKHYITGFLAIFSPSHGAWALRGGAGYNFHREERIEDIPPHADYPDEN